jgi:hypothetical protein
MRFTARRSQSWNWRGTWQYRPKYSGKVISDGAALRTQQHRHDAVLAGSRVAAPLRYVVVGLVIYEACGILGAE